MLESLGREAPEKKALRALVWETGPEAPGPEGPAKAASSLAESRRADAGGGEDATGAPDARVPQAAPGSSSADRARKL